MGRIKTLFKNLKIKVKGRLKCAVDEGMRCGKNVTQMGNVDFGSEPYLITLGDNVRISRDVIFSTHDGGSWVFRREGKYRDVVRFAPISVGDNTFIGARAIILPGVSIGANCVIAAGAVVTRDVPDGSVAAGVPAKVISTVEEYAEKMKARMPADWDPASLEKDKRKYLESVFGR